MSAAVRLAWSSASAGSSTRVRSSIILSIIQRQPRKAGDVAPLQDFAPRNFRRRIDTARGDFVEPSPRARHRLEQRRIGFPWYVLGAGDSEDLRACFVGPARERNPEVDPNTAGVSCAFSTISIRVAALSVSGDKSRLDSDTSLSSSLDVRDFNFGLLQGGKHHRSVLEEGFSYGDNDSLHLRRWSSPSTFRMACRTSVQFARYIVTVAAFSYSCYLSGDSLAGRARYHFHRPLRSARS